MKCSDNKIKELLPAYLDQKLDRPDRNIVEEHLQSCEDCRSELSLLTVISREAVPDPGETFWKEMPGRVYREVQRQKEKKHFTFPNIVNLFTPGWGWATAAVAAIAIALWFLVRPAPVDIARNVVHENGTGFEEMAVSGEPINLAELSSTELDAATQWAQNEFAPIGEAVSDERIENTQRDISEELSNLSPRELDRVYEMLKKKEQELKERSKKMKSRKDVG